MSLLQLDSCWGGDDAGDLAQPHAHDCLLVERRDSGAEQHTRHHVVGAAHLVGVGVGVGLGLGWGWRLGLGLGLGFGAGVRGKVRATAHQLGRRPAELAQPPLVGSEPCAIRHHEDARLVAVQLEQGGGHRGPCLVEWRRRDLGDGQVADLRQPVRLIVAEQQ